jgi:hypothetical protein
MSKTIPILTFLILLCSDFGFCQTISSDSVPVNLGKQINSKQADIAPVISPDGKTLYFSKDHYRKEFERDKERAGYFYMIGVEYQHIYYSLINELGEWGSAKRMGAEMNNAEFNSLCSISPDGNSILVYKSPKLFISKKNGNSWGTLIEQKIDDFYDSSHFCNFFLSNSGRYLLSSVTRSKKRKEDLYVSFLLADNHWSKPKNLGSGINSFEREISPFLASDDRTLYFASNVWGGLGEMDIYVSHRHDSSWTDWSPPKNLGSPINSEGWDAYLSIPAAGEEAYFVSTRNGFGEEDIYRIKLPEWAKPHPLTIFIGKVLDKKTREPLSAEIIYNQVENDDEGGKTFTNPLTGEFKISIHADEDYVLTIGKRDYLFQEEVINSGLNNKNFYLEEIRRICGPSGLVHIFFELNEINIGLGFEVEIIKIAEFLKSIPEVKIKTVGYTDNRGSSNYNLKLSLKRATAVKECLMRRGIEGSRIVEEGLGEANPVGSNDTEEGRKVNRRVEFVILE